MFAIEYHDAFGTDVFIECQYMSDLLHEVKRLLGDGVKTMEVMRIKKNAEA